MDKLSMCRICLIADIRMHYLDNMNLQETYEILTGTQFETKDKPLQVCYICCAKLQNCYKLRTISIQSDKLFNQMLENNTCKPRKLQDLKLQIAHPPIIHLSIDSDDHKDLSDNYNVLKMDHLTIIDDVQIKEEHIEVVENTIGKELTIQFIGQDVIKDENVTLENGVFDYKIQTIKTESDLEHVTLENEHVTLENGVLDYKIQTIKTEPDLVLDSALNLEDHCTQTNVFQTNHGISSVDLQNIKRQKTSHIVLQQLKESNDVIQCGPDPDKGSLLNQEDISESANSNTLKHLEIYKINKNIDDIHSKQMDIAKIIRTGAGEKPHKCGTCGKSYIKKNGLIAHIRTHTGEKPYSCVTCGKCFSTKVGLFLHIRIHTGEKPYKCDICGKSFIVNSKLTTHIRTHPGEKPYKCVICGICFLRKSELTSHIPTHTEATPFKCDICGKFHKRKDLLSIHMRSHTGERPYQCDVCGKSFASRAKLVTHIRVHIGRKSCKCDTCGKSFISNYKLLAHIRTHTGEKPFACNTCGKCYITKDRLSTHMRSHTGEKSFKCMKPIGSVVVVTESKISTEIIKPIQINKSPTNVVPYKFARIAPKPFK